MAPEDIEYWLKAEPFQPFRITMTAGRTYDVRHPEFVMILVDAIVIGTPLAEGDVRKRGSMIGLSLIDRIEPIEPPPSPPPEKQAGKGKKK